MSCKLVIFDFDGTLSDTRPHILSCGQKCIDKFHLRQPTKEEIASMGGGVFANTMMSLGATEDMIDDLKKYYKEIFLEDVSDITLYDGVLDTLTKLKESGIKLAIATNRGREILLPLLKHLGLEDVFDDLVCESDVQNKKPHPEMIELILDKLKFQKEDSLIVGDTKYDVLLGKNSNIRTCLVDYNKKGYNEEAKPDFIVHNFKDIIDVLATMNNDVMNNCKQVR